MLETCIKKCGWRLEVLSLLLRVQRVGPGIPTGHPVYHIHIEFFGGPRLFGRFCVLASVVSKAQSLHWGNGLNKFA